MSVTTHSKATEVCRVYLVHSVTVTEHDGSSWVFCSQAYYLTSSGAREGDNVVFVRVPGDLFEPMFFTFTNTLQTGLIKLQY